MSSGHNDDNKDGRRSRRGISAMNPFTVSASHSQVENPVQSRMVDLQIDFLMW